MTFTGIKRRRRQQQSFYSHYTSEPALAAPSVKNCRTLLELIFTAGMPLLMATSEFHLGEDAKLLLNSIIYINSVPC